jgi:hypothetical protein
MTDGEHTIKYRRILRSGEHMIKYSRVRMSGEYKHGDEL